MRKSRIGIGGAALLVALVGFGCDYGLQKTASRVYADPVYTGTAGELFLAYNDAKGGGAALNDQVVQVTGEVYLKTEDESGEPALLLSTGERNRSQRIGPVEFVKCIFHDRFRDQARRIKLGQTVTIRGVVIGMDGNLVLRDCLKPLEKGVTTVEARANYPSGS